mmetsp:Transcript_5968/g.7245  ORF Transcript_5968/g.7245 Transcript_5968/m.7245 type:complete len:319 (+) Transcript_5968:195-1151(+)
MNFGTKFSLLKQRVIGGGDQEPEELKVVRRKVQSFIPDLKKVRKAFNTWLEGAKALGNASEQMSSALQGSDVELQNIADTVAKELKFDSKHNDYAGAASLCTSAILSINKKIKLLDALKAKGDELENWRLQKNRLKRKMQEYEKKGDAEGVRKLDSELQTARSNYSSLYNELMAKYGYLIQMSDGKDGIGIVQTELIAFKHSQLLFFKNCAKTCQQYEVTTISSLEDEWLKFEMKLEQKVIERGQKANLRHQSSSAQVNDSGMITSENNAVIAGGVRASTEHLPTVNEGTQKLTLPTCILSIITFSLLQILPVQTLRF